MDPHSYSGADKASTSCLAVWNRSMATEKVVDLVNLKVGIPMCSPQRCIVLLGPKGAKPPKALQGPRGDIRLYLEVVLTLRFNQHFEAREKHARIESVGSLKGNAPRAQEHSSIGIESFVLNWH